MQVGMIGLGRMGANMVRRLMRAGHECVVYNRTAAKAEQWVKQYGKGRTAPTPAAAAREADFIFCCVGNDDDVRSVMYGDDGIFAGCKPGAIAVDHTTASAILARELDTAAQERGLHFIDAPVSV